MPFKIVKGDITTIKTDAVVNAANPALKRGGGVCGAIFSAAGITKLQAACDVLSPVKTGEAVITEGFALPAKHIIHAVGPVWRGGGNNEAQLLRNAYLNALSLAVEHGLLSIAFPLISSGIYGYPKEEALRVAGEAIKEFLMDHDLDVRLVIFDRKEVKLPEEKERDINFYLRRNFRRPVSHREIEIRGDADPAIYLINAPSEMQTRTLQIEDFIDTLADSFSRTLFRRIDEKGLSDVAVYKKANLDRKLFSKIRSHEDYRPNKTTALALSLALELNLEETEDLIGRAGYTLSPASRWDVIIKYHIEHKRYDIFEINETLFAYGEKIIC